MNGCYSISFNWLVLCCERERFGLRDNGDSCWTKVSLNYTTSEQHHSVVPRIAGWNPCSSLIIPPGLFPLGRFVPSFPRWVSVESTQQCQVSLHKDASLQCEHGPRHPESHRRRSSGNYLRRAISQIMSRTKDKREMDEGEWASLRRDYLEAWETRPGRGFTVLGVKTSPRYWDLRRDNQPSPTTWRHKAWQKFIKTPIERQR
jgi:hypothetical protein